MQMLAPILGVIVALATAARAVENLPAPAGHAIDFTKDIKPLFEASCVKCHAKGKAKGGFSLQDRAALLKGGDTGPGAEPGKSAESIVVELVAGIDPDNVMPKKGTKWTPEQVGLLRAWLEQGAAWPANITFAKPPPQNLHPRAITLAGRTGAHPIDRPALWSREAVADR